jgi:hypothetical protein
MNVNEKGMVMMFGYPWSENFLTADNMINVRILINL